MGPVSRQFRLPDGRRLGYDDHGPPAGRPVVLFHGTPSSRYDWYLFGSEALARELDIRVIAPDRPGLGLSDYQPGRRICDWSLDVVALADELGLDRFAVLGYSGGGPYVMACALEMPERLTTAGIVSSIGPYHGSGSMGDFDSAILPFLTQARNRPQLFQATLRLMGRLARQVPPSLIARAMVVFPQPDGEVLARRKPLQVLMDAFVEALRPGPRGVCWDTALMVSPWGFDPHDIAAPVHLWHGEDDRFVSPAVARHLAEALLNGRARLYPGEGHVSVLVNRAEDILRELVDGGGA